MMSFCKDFPRAQSIQASDAQMCSSWSCLESKSSLWEGDCAPDFAWDSLSIWLLSCMSTVKWYRSSYLQTVCHAHLIYRHANSHTCVHTHAHGKGGTTCILFLHFLITKFLPGLRAHTVIPISRRLRQKDCHEPWVQGKPVLYSICHLKGLHRESLSKETKKMQFSTAEYSEYPLN